MTATADTSLRLHSSCQSFDARCRSCWSGGMETRNGTDGIRRHIPWADQAVLMLNSTYWSSMPLPMDLAGASHIHRTGAHSSTQRRLASLLLSDRNSSRRIGAGVVQIPLFDVIEHSGLRCGCVAAESIPHAPSTRGRRPAQSSPNRMVEVLRVELRSTSAGSNRVRTIAALQLVVLIGL